VLGVTGDAIAVRPSGQQTYAAVSTTLFLDPIDRSHPSTVVSST
jgi:hypothetical protein